MKKNQERAGNYLIFFLQNFDNNLDGFNVHLKRKFHALQFCFKNEQPGFVERNSECM